MTFKPINTENIDTLFEHVSEYETKTYNNVKYIDSLFIVSDHILLKFGVCTRPESVISDIMMNEIKNDSYENR